MSEVRTDLFAHNEATRQLREFFLYARPDPDTVAAPTLAEPPPPDHSDEPDAADPVARLEQCMALQAKTVLRLESERQAFREGGHHGHPGHSAALLLVLLQETIQRERDLLEAHRALRSEADVLRNQRDELAATLRYMEALSLTDELTGLPNRRAFVQRLDLELSRHQRSNEPLAMVLLDIDHFKAINDVHGHYVGDMMLRCYARRMVPALRQHDLLARYGGEEFALLLPDTQPGAARLVLEKLAREIRREPLDTASDSPIDLPSFSAGIASLRPGETAMALINRADQSLYLAKRQGRNRIETDEQFS